MITPEQKKEAFTKIAALPLVGYAAAPAVQSYVIPALATAASATAAWLSRDSLSRAGTQLADGVTHAGTQLADGVTHAGKWMADQAGRAADWMAGKYNNAMNTQFTTPFTVSPRWVNPLWGNSRPIYTEPVKNIQRNGIPMIDRPLPIRYAQSSSAAPASATTAPNAPTPAPTSPLSGSDPSKLKRFWEMTKRVGRNWWKVAPAVEGAINAAPGQRIKGALWNYPETVAMTADLLKGGVQAAWRAAHKDWGGAKDALFESSNRWGPLQGLRDKIRNNYHATHYSGGQRDLGEVNQNIYLPTGNPFSLSGAASLAIDGMANWLEYKGTKQQRAIEAEQLRQYNENLDNYR